jgi:hypothetical protein
VVTAPGGPLPGMGVVRVAGAIPEGRVIGTTIAVMCRRTLLRRDGDPVDGETRPQATPRPRGTVHRRVATTRVPADDGGRAELGPVQPTGVASTAIAALPGTTTSKVDCDGSDGACRRGTG